MRKEVNPWCCRNLFLAALLLLVLWPAAATAADRAARFQEYDARRTETLEKMAQGNNLTGATARLYLNKDVETANRIVLEANLGHWTEHIRQLALYEMFNADTGHRAKLLSREATDKLHAHMWECFQLEHGKGPYGKCRHFGVDVNIPWHTWGNQNHGFVFQSWFYTAATALKDIPRYAGQFDPEKHIHGHSMYEDYRKGLTLAGYAEDLRQLWSTRLQWYARHGLWAEDSVYRCYDIAATYNLAYHANDPDIRRRASMILDLHWLIYALHMVDDQLGGAMNRFKGGYTHYHFDRGLGQYYFGGKGGGFHSTEVALFGDYLPPQIAYDLLADQKKRGCFIYRERLQSSQPESHKYKYKYSYVTPEYALGSYIAHDLEAGPGRYSERAFNGIAFGKAKAILRLGPTVSFQSYHCMQNGPILLARWYGREIVGEDTEWGKRVGERQPYASIISREAPGAPIKPIVKPAVIEGGWLFVEAGDAWFAMRPALGQCTVHAENKQQFEWAEAKTPLVIHAGGASEDGTFDAFKKKVLANTITYQDGVLTYEDAKWGKMEFCPDPTRPADQWRRIDGEPVELPDKLFDSPYLTSDYDSGVITAEFNGRKLVLDFNKIERREEP